MFLTLNLVNIEEIAISCFIFLHKMKFDIHIFEINFAKIKIFNFFLTKKISKHFSSVNMPDMEKIHTLKKICFDLKISFFNFFLRALVARGHHQKMHFLNFIDSYVTYFGAQRARNRARDYKMYTNRFV